MLIHLRLADLTMRLFASFQRQFGWKDYRNGLDILVRSLIQCVCVEISGRLSNIIVIGNTHEALGFSVA